MTPDTVFDCASLTKVVATTASLMKLFEQGKFRLNDRVTDYSPEFQGGKSDITLRTLFTHFSGLQPDVPLKQPWTGYDTGIRLACTFSPGGPPGVRYVYSDINFILLGELVHRLSGKMVSAYARENIFLPLGMKTSMFQPPAALIPRIAPTERPTRSAAPLRGVVHDPWRATWAAWRDIPACLPPPTTGAFRADDAQWRRSGASASSAHHRGFTERARPIKPSAWPGRLGYRFADSDAAASSSHRLVRPHRFPGTSMWMDGDQHLCHLLANVHPDRRPAITPLRSKVRDHRSREHRPPHAPRH
jgi:CubicO group peptidase (beta-lactamase class C family)